MNKLWCSVALMWLAGTALAGKRPPRRAAARAEAKKPAAASEKVTGEVVDITCLLGHDGKGDKHASCAQKCLSAGLPAGLVIDGKLYLVTMKDHTAPAAKLASYGGKLVSATGQ